MNEIFAFEVWPKAKPEWAETINARSAGRAKSEYLRALLEAWPNVPYTTLRHRKCGGPATSRQFVRNAIYRGLPELKCGDAVSVGAATGRVVGHDSSANILVLFNADSPKYANQKLSVHPDDLEVATEPAGGGRESASRGASQRDVPTTEAVA